MTETRPTLYISRLLPDPIMAIVRERFQLVQEPVDALPDPSALRDGLCQADVAIVTLGDRIDAETIHAAARLKILANYAVGYNNIDLAAAQQRGLIVTNTPDVLTDTTADLTWALILATARRMIEGDVLVRSGKWTGWSPTQLLGAEVSGKILGISAWDGSAKRSPSVRQGFAWRCAITHATRWSPPLSLPGGNPDRYRISLGRRIS